MIIPPAVRHESPADWERVERVVRDAFGQDAEARLVASLRSIPGALSLVATVDTVIVGHAMFTPVTARGKSPATAAYGLAPVSVAPDWQGRGIGSHLINAGLEELRRARVGLVVVLGHASYYPRLGFVAAAPLGLTCKWAAKTARSKSSSWSMVPCWGTRASLTTHRRSTNSCRQYPPAVGLALR